MKKDKLITMHEMYGEPNDKFGRHIACRECGFCKTCGDCKKHDCSELTHFTSHNSAKPF